MNILNSVIKLYYNDTEYITLNGNVEITNSLYNLTSTCTIHTSKASTYVSQDGFYIREDLFTLGSKVEVWLGYGIEKNLTDGTLKNIFNGFVNNYSTTSNSLQIDFEDNMYILKHMPRVKNSWKDSDELSLPQFIEWLLPDRTFDFVIMDINLGSLTIKNKLLPSEILKMLKEAYGIYCYFKNDILYVGHQYWDLYGDTAKTIKFGHPVKKEFNYVIENEMTYLIVDSNSYRVKGSSIYNNNKLLYDYPENIEDPDNIITLNLNGLNLESLKTLVKEKYDNLEKGGLLGDFTTFGIPIVNHGDIVDLNYNFSYIKDDNKDGQKDLREQYYVDEVITSFGDEGYRQNIKIGTRII